MRKRVKNILRGLLILVILMLVTLIVRSPVRAEDNKSNPEKALNQLLVKVSSDWNNKIRENPQDTGVTDLDKLFKEYEVKSFKRLAKVNSKSNSDAEIFSWYQIEANGNVDEIKDKLSKRGEIEEVEYNYLVKVNINPNDPYYLTSGSWGQLYPDLWGLHKINIGEAWNIVTSSPGVVIASIDSGVDRDHPELVGMAWNNSEEVPGNGIDDDANGYIDDYYGWDWVNNDNDPMDDYGHGTHTVGTMMAKGNNNLGIVGISWEGKYMALKFLGANGSGYISNAIEALQYAADNGAKISNNSWACYCHTVALDDAIKYEHDKGMVIVASAGNDAEDALDVSPASSDWAITVGAIYDQDIRTGFTNMGNKIDVVAPGVSILSLKSRSGACSPVVGADYCLGTGTSMSAPHVAGLVSLAWAENPSLTNEEIRQVLRNTSVDLGDVGKDIYYGFGRIDAANFLGKIHSGTLVPVISAPSSRKVYQLGEAIQVYGGITGQGYQDYVLEIGKGRNPITWTEINRSSSPIENGLLGEVNTGNLGSGIYTIRLTARDTAGKLYYFYINDITISYFTVEIIKPLDGSTLFINKVQPIQASVNYPASDIDYVYFRIEKYNNPGYELIYSYNDTVYPYTFNWKVPRVIGATYQITAIARSLTGGIVIDWITVYTIKH